MKITNTLCILICGIVCGFLLFFSPGTFAIVVCVCLITAAIWRHSGKQGRNFLVRLFIFSFIIRCIAVIVAHYCAQVRHSYSPLEGFNALTIFGDDGYYTLLAHFLVMNLKGAVAVPIVQIGKYGWNNYIFVLGAFNYLFGYSPIASVFLNCIMGSLLGIVVYLIANDIFGISTARIAAVLVNFFPTFILWSIANLKDIPLILSIMIMLFCYFRVFFQKKLKYVIPFIVMFIFSYHYTGTNLYSKIFVVSVSCSTVGIFFYTVLKQRNVFITKFCAVLIIVYFGVVSIFKVGVIANKAASLFQAALVQHTGVLSSGGIIYKLVDGQKQAEYYYSNIPYFTSFFDYATFFLRGFFHFFGEPFPSSIQSIMLLFFYPFVIIWYGLLAVAVVGIIITLRYRFKYAVVLLTYLFSMGLVLLLTGGNVGTDIRHRDMISPYIYIFSSVGIAFLLGKIKKNER
jgi:hypothetical protein